MRSPLHQLGVVAANVLAGALGVLAPDEHVQGVTEYAPGPEAVVDDRIHDHVRGYGPLRIESDSQEGGVALRCAR
jgi:hypothetical protein